MTEQRSPRIVEAPVGGTVHADLVHKCHVTLMIHLKESYTDCKLSFKAAFGTIIGSALANFHSPGAKSKRPIRSHPMQTLSLMNSDFHVTTPKLLGKKQRYWWKVGL